MKLVSVTYSPQVFNVGDVLTITATVFNDGNSGATSQQPFSGYQYDEDDSFSSTSPPQPPQAGAWRILAGTLPRMTTTGNEFPYRWGFAGTLAPQKTVTIVGKVKILAPTGLLFYVGLAQEVNQFVGDPHSFKQVIALAGGGSGDPTLPPRVTTLEGEVNVLQTGVAGLTNAQTAIQADVTELKDFEAKIRAA